MNKEKLAELMDGSVRKIMDLRVELASRGCLTPVIDSHLVRAVAELSPFVYPDMKSGLKYILDLKSEYEKKLQEAAVEAATLRDSIVGIDEVEDFLKNISGE